MATRKNVLVNALPKRKQQTLIRRLGKPWQRRLIRFTLKEGFPVHLVEFTVSTKILKCPPMKKGQDILHCQRGLISALRTALVKSAKNRPLAPARDAR